VKKRYSQALGVEFDLHDDGACDIEGVRYSPAEVRLLANSKGVPEEVRAVHAVKKIFNGEMLGN
jgi:hypothetical protein